MRQCVTRLADNTGPAETNIEIIETDVTIECLPGSTLPAELRKAGYDITELDEGERILPAAIVEKFTRRADGELEPLSEGSTKPIAETTTHAGIVKVKRWAFSMP